MSSLFREMHGKRPGIGATVGSIAKLGATSVFVTLNKSPSKCEWSTRQGVKACDFPKHRLVEGLPVITLPVGTKLYHATLIFGKEKEWFTDDLSKSHKPYMWFGSTRPHAEEINHTHILEYTVNEEIEVAYIHNMYKHAKVTRGQQYMWTKFEGDRAKYEERGIEIEGYAGCNECEFLLLKSAYPKLSEPVVVAKKSVKYVDGGGKTRKRLRRFRCTRKLRY